MKWKSIGILLISIFLLGLAGIAITKGFATDERINVLNTDEQRLEISPTVNVDNSGIQTTGLQTMVESPATGLKFSGEVVSCTINTDVGQKIDLRLSNLDVENQSISVYPLNTTIELLKNTILRIDLALPYGVSSLILESSNGEALTVGVPPCISGGWSGSSSQSSFSSSTEVNNPPPPVPELSTIALTGLGIFGLILIISRSKQ